MNRPSYGRHITTTFSWVLGNTITNTELESCWTKGGEKKSLIPITSTSVPSKQRSWSTANTSIWWVCTSHTRNMRITTSRRCTKLSRKHMTNNKKCILIIGGDFNAELGPGKGTECKSVGKYTLNESNKRGDWLKSWLMLNDYSALNTMFKNNATKTDVLRLSNREKEANRLHLDQEKILEQRERRWSERHDPHGKWPWMYYGYLLD